jgi:SAM-dependent methyltransferase
MGEIFAAAKARNALEFTGERWTGAVAGQIEVEHLHRYFLARDLCRDKDVLDIACGEGYGAALLAQVARSVVAVDIDCASVAHAAAEYRQAHLNFAVGDACRIPLATASCDVAISFETLEHLAEQDKFLAELRRVLRPDGVLLISTPDSDVYSPIGRPANRFHVRELSREEFAAILSRHFGRVTMLVQRPLIGSVIVPRQVNGRESEVVTYERRDSLHFERSNGLPRGLYQLACVANRPIEPLVGASFYIETGELDARGAEWAAHQSWQSVGELESRLAHAQQHLAAVLNSTSWRVAAPLRALATLIHRLTDRTRPRSR